MTFIWSDTGCIREYVFGMKTHGLKQQGQRPDVVFYTQDEVDACSLTPDQLNKYLERVGKALKVYF